MIRILTFRALLVEIMSLVASFASAGHAFSRRSLIKPRHGYQLNTCPVTG
jgi:hypothetical protein